MLVSCVPRWGLHSLDRQEEAQHPAAPEDVAQVDPPGALALYQLPPPQLAPGLAPGHQQHLLQAEAGACEADAQPHVQHQHQEELEARNGT